MAKVRYLGPERLFTYRSAPSGIVYDFHANDLLDVDVKEDVECFRGGNFEVIESGMEKAKAEVEKETRKVLEKVKYTAGRRKKVS